MPQCSARTSGTDQQCKNMGFRGGTFCYVHLSPVERKQAEKDAPAKSLTTDDQEQLIASVIFLKQYLFEETIRKINRTLIAATAVVVPILTVAGVYLISSVKTQIVTEAVRSLSTDISIRDSVANQAGDRIETATKLIEKSKELVTEVENEKARALRTISTDLAEIQKMMSKVMDDIQKLRPPN